MLFVTIQASEQHWQVLGTGTTPLFLPTVGWCVSKVGSRTDGRAIVFSLAEKSGDLFVLGSEDQASPR